MLPALPLWHVLVNGPSSQRPNALPAVWPTRRRIHLPLELVDIVTDYLWDDKASLAACSLVCKLWLESATYHLFRVVVVADDATCTRFLEFASLLHSGNPRSFGARIEELYLESSPSGQPMTPLVTIDLQVLAAILYPCSKLRHLQMNRVRWTRSPGQEYLPITVPKVATLAFIYRESHLLPDFPGIFQWFPNATECVLEGGYIPSLETYQQPSPKNAEPQPFPWSMQLQALHFKSHKVSPYLYTWVARTASASTLQSLRIAICKVDDLPYIATLLQSVKRTLIDLTLDLSSSEYAIHFLCSGQTPAVLSKLSLHECSAIQHLHLIINMIRTAEVEWSGPPVTTSPMFILDMLTMVHSPTFAYLTLEFVGDIRHLIYQLSVIEWEFIKTALIQHPTIQAVMVTWDPEWDNIDRDMPQHMVNIFPGLQLAGKLVFA